MSTSEQTTFGRQPGALTMLDPLELVGQSIGPYQVTEKISQGGMGVVYRARRADGRFEREVAIKFIIGALTKDIRRRFAREMRVLAALQHPNLVLLYDAGEFGAEVPYIVMEYVAGETLQALLERQGRLPLAETLQIAQQAAAGLQAAHSAGVIHRDVKPANLIVNFERGGLRVKVLDFGIAFPQHEDVQVTSVRARIGTFFYMSPEQMQFRSGPELTPASDVFALAAIVYEMLTGQLYFERRQQPLPPHVARLDATLPHLFEPVLLKGLAETPQDRFQTTEAFAQALMEAAQASQTLPVPGPRATTVVQQSAEASQPLARDISLASPTPLTAKITPSLSSHTAKAQPVSVVATRPQIQPVPTAPANGPTSLGIRPLPTLAACVTVLILITVSATVYYQRVSSSAVNNVTVNINNHASANNNNAINNSTSNNNANNNGANITAQPPAVVTQTVEAKPVTPDGSAASPRAMPADTRLPLRLNIRDRASMPESGCTFALFRPQLDAVPPPNEIKPEHLQLVFTDIGRQADGKVAGLNLLATGVYWSKFACKTPRHTPVISRVTIAPDPQNPGVALVPLSWR